MQDYESIDDLIDKKINKIDFENNEIKKRRPIPFRYIKNEENLKNQVIDDLSIPFTLMKSSESETNKIKDVCISNVNNYQKILKIINNHKEIFVSFHYPCVLLL